MIASINTLHEPTNCGLILGLNDVEFEKLLKTCKCIEKINKESVEYIALHK